MSRRLCAPPQPVRTLRRQDNETIRNRTTISLLCDRITWHYNYDIPALLYYMSVGKIGWTMRATADIYNEFSCV